MGVKWTLCGGEGEREKGRKGNAQGIEDGIREWEKRKDRRLVVLDRRESIRDKGWSWRCGEAEGRCEGAKV